MKPNHEADVSREDAEAALEHAAKISTQTADRMRVDDVMSAGAEVGLSKEHVQKGLDAVEQKHMASRERWAKIHGFVAVACVTIGALFFIRMIIIGALITTLQGRHATVELDRSLMRTQLNRQAMVEARFPSNSPEVAGAINRVAIARRRYDEAATEYNLAVERAGGQTAAEEANLPARVPLANEVTTW